MKNLASGNTIDQPVRLEQDLPEFEDAKRIEFLRHAAVARRALERLDLHKKAIEQCAGIIDRALMLATRS